MRKLKINQLQEKADAGDRSLTGALLDQDTNGSTSSSMYTVRNDP